MNLKEFIIELQKYPSDTIISFGNVNFRNVYEKFYKDYNLDGDSIEKTGTTQGSKQLIIWCEE